MIRRLLLQNWRAYEKADVEFRPGTTFVVARNGVGKSSLIEAARWAVFGEVLTDPKTAIKLGAKEAMVEVDLELPDGKILKIRRTLERPRVRVVSDLQASLEGRELSASDVTTVLEEAWKANMLFVSRTAFLTEGFRSEKDPDLLEQLSRAFGISDLKRARDELALPIRELSGSLKDSRSQAKDRGAELDQLRDKISAARALEVESGQKLEMMRTELTEASNEVRLLDDAANAMKQRHTWEGTMADLATKAFGSIANLDLSDVPAALEEKEQALNDSLEERRRQRAIVEGRIQAVETGLQQMLGADAECPVCRRPLRAEDREHAQRGHDDELELLRDEYNRLDFAELLEEMQRIQSFTRQALAIGPLPVVPVIDPSLDPSQSRRRLEEAKGGFEEAVRIHQDHETRRKVLEEESGELKSDLAEQQELEAQYRKLVFLETTQMTIESVVDEALHGYIAPLAEEIRDKWKVLFADRPHIQLDPSGNLTRLIEGESLPFEAFSAGEQMSAKLLLCLVILSASTSAGFCWIDEPLEHLDPTTRRLTAGMLARGSTTTGIRQMVVTTYEDELARRLVEEDDSARLVYVRTRPGMTEVA